MPYQFTPPVRDYRAGPPSDRLWGRVKNAAGLAVVLYDSGRVVTLDVAPSHSDDGVAAVWAGGRTYTLTDEQALTLSDAGYGRYLEEVYG